MALSVDIRKLRRRPSTCLLYHRPVLLQLYLHALISPPLSIDNFGICPDNRPRRENTATSFLCFTLPNYRQFVRLPSVSQDGLCPGHFVFAPASHKTSAIESHRSTDSQRATKPQRATGSHRVFERGRGSFGVLCLLPSNHCQKANLLQFQTCYIL